MPKSCFIIYSNDSKNHSKWVERFAKKLRSYKINVRLDQIDTHLGDDLVKFMTTAMESDRVIVICTPKYYLKNKGGAAFEKMIVAGELVEEADTNKFIPILKEGNKKTSIPTYLHTKKFKSMLGSRIKSSDMKEIADTIKKTSKSNQQSTASAKIPSIKRKSVVLSVSSDVSDVSRLRLSGYTLLGGRGSDGIRYLWKTPDNILTESSAFNNRIKAFDVSPADKKISAYTTSVCFGCQLQNMHLACCFCATGCLRYRGPLTGEEIALQNIFMAGYDAECPSWPQVRSNAREFAFMGQGEPGFCYAQVRRAILLTDYAMKKIGQKVHRYILASCGIHEMLDILAEDLKKGTFKNRVTLHFSLHAVEPLRNALMPINKLYPYDKFLSKTKKIFDITKDKIAIGILLFDNFIPTTQQNKIASISEAYLEKILDKLNPKIHRIDLCDVNANKAISNQHEVSNEKANNLLSFTKHKGFEAKLFSSFGTDKHAGCGMLTSSKAKIQIPGTVTVRNFEKAIDLLRNAIQHVK